MTWDEYRRVGDRGDVMTRSLLARTRVLVDDAAAAAIDELLSHRPIEKPDGFRGDDRVDLFEVVALAPWVEGVIVTLRRRGADRVMIKQWEACAGKLNV